MKNSVAEAFRCFSHVRLSIKDFIHKPLVGRWLHLVVKMKTDPFQLFSSQGFQNACIFIVINNHINKYDYNGILWGVFAP